MILQGSDADLHRHIPKIINECLKRLKTLLSSDEDVRGDNYQNGTLKPADLEDSILLPLEISSKPKQLATPKPLTRISRHGAFDPELAEQQKAALEESINKGEFSKENPLNPIKQMQQANPPMASRNDDGTVTLNLLMAPAISIKDSTDASRNVSSVLMKAEDTAQNMDTQ